jgi:Bacteriophage probable baseplate hub protein
VVEHQGPRRRAACQIVVGGMQDVTDRLHPYLISVQVIDTEGAADECHIELDDRNAELIIPPDDVKLSVALGWAGEGPRLFDSGRKSKVGGQGPILMTQKEIDTELRFGGPGLRIVFDGWVKTVESGFGRRGGGRRLWITAKGHDDKGPVKEEQQQTMGEGKKEDGQDGKQIPLKDMMSQVFGAAGLSVAISPAMEKIARDFWSIRDSPMNFGRRMADELGGLFKITSNKAILTSAKDGMNAAGEAMPTIEAIWGINLIGWRIQPFTSHPQWGKGQAKFFDLANGIYKSVSTAIGGSAPFGASKAIANSVNTVVDQAQGKQATEGTGTNSESNRGTGWVLLNGEPNAKAGGSVVISGARPGVDGTYMIQTAEHNYTRGVGYTTRCNVWSPKPSGGYETWQQNTGAPILEPGDPGFIGPMPWPDVPDQADITFTYEELGRVQEIERLREEQRKQQQNGLLPITRDELPADGSIPQGYYLVGPPPEPQQTQERPATETVFDALGNPIFGEQTFTAEQMELIRQGNNEELARQKDINDRVNEAMKEMNAADAARQEEIKKEVGDLLDQLKPGGKLPADPSSGVGDDVGLQ